MKEDNKRWRRLCELVKVLSGADIYVSCPLSVSAAGVPLANPSPLGPNRGPILSFSMLLTTSLEFPLLVGADVVKMGPKSGSAMSVDEIDEKCDVLRKRIMKLNTALVYKQQKYNLLREELEGYSKLVTVLCKMPHMEQLFSVEGDGEAASYIRNILSLIGQFELDPNRVLDVVLDAFEQQPSNLSFVALLKQFPQRNIVHVVGFKFLNYQSAAASVTANTPTPSSADLATVGVEQRNTPVLGRPSTSDPAKPPVKVPAPPAGDGQVLSPKPVERAGFHSSTPASLYAVSAVLVMCELVHLDDLLLYLQPPVEEILKDAQQAENLLEKEIKSHGMINLNASATTPVAATASTAAASCDSIAQAPVSIEVTAGNPVSDKRPPPPPLPPSSSSAPLPTSLASLISVAASSFSKPPPPSYPPPKGIALQSAVTTAGKPAVLPPSLKSAAAAVPESKVQYEAHYLDGEPSSQLSCTRTLLWKVAPSSWTSFPSRIGS